MGDLVSIIMPAFNTGNFIAGAIGSALKQTYTKFELLIYNDNSTDDTESVVKRFIDVDPRIKLFGGDVNIGASGARNYLINKSIGRYIAFLDSDDKWNERKLECQLRFFTTNSRTAILGSNGNLIDKKDNLQISNFISLKEFDMSAGAVLLFRNNFALSSVIIDLKLISKNDLVFNTLIKKIEDYDLWIRLAIKYGDRCFKNINEPLFDYRIHENQTTATWTESDRLSFIDVCFQYWDFLYGNQDIFLLIKYYLGNNRRGKEALVFQEIKILRNLYQNDHKINTLINEVVVTMRQELGVVFFNYLCKFRMFEYFRLHYSSKFW